MSIAITLHLLGVIIWVGGMFFAHMVLRGAVGKMLEPRQRLQLMIKVFDGFFPWVWFSVLAILTSGYWMLFVFNGMEIHFWLLFMSLVGTLMAVIFVFVYLLPYHQLGAALKIHDIPKAVASITLIRQLILTNLILGLLVTLAAMFGKYGLI